jgi:hypothetical protein
MPWKKLHQLGENRLALKHGWCSSRSAFFPEGVPKGSSQIQIDNDKKRSY